MLIAVGNTAARYKSHSLEPPIQLCHLLHTSLWGDDGSSGDSEDVGLLLTMYLLMCPQVTFMIFYTYHSKMVNSHNVCADKLADDYAD